MEGLVRKSKGFFPRNLSNPKGKSFNAEGISCGGEGKLIAASLKEKMVEGFSQGITLGFFNSSIQAQVLAHSFR